MTFLRALNAVMSRTFKLTALGLSIRDFRADLITMRARFT
jgi:hypothetical protein